MAHESCSPSVALVMHAQFCAFSLISTYLPCIQHSIAHSLSLVAGTVLIETQMNKRWWEGRETTRFGISYGS
jgi:hypothetical protein